MTCPPWLNTCGQHSGYFYQLCDTVIPSPTVQEPAIEGPYFNSQVIKKSRVKTAKCLTGCEGTRKSKPVTSVKQVSPEGHLHSSFETHLLIDHIQVPL